MADYSAFVPASPVVAECSTRLPALGAFVPASPVVAECSTRLPALSAMATSGAATTTYYYRASDGSRGSATSLDAIPAGAVIERTVTA